ncbi:aminotransferase class IV [Odoribacter lunatus]|uniref:aminotransferase class IV n=1 Tax=Odoribacter lunatus TaxID=2941335 RepID=UPI0020400E12|nr:aminotransferase class IV [Odoribacter lunatus]
MLINNIATDSTSFSENILENGLSIYEVIRVFRGTPIFLKDNLLRLDNSLKKSNIHIDIQNLHLPDKLNRLIRLEHLEEGNIKYVLHFLNNQTNEYLYVIPHSYPSREAYQQGVNTITHEAVRVNPEVKYLNPELRATSDRLIKENNVYEVILVDNDGCVTEGSRSNIFFIQQNTLYTAPYTDVLPGTSRKRVFDICKTEKIEIVEKKIKLDTLSDYEAAFITGTSPLILPIRQINSISYKTSHPLLRRLMQLYFTLLERID